VLSRVSAGVCNAKVYSCAARGMPTLVLHSSRRRPHTVDTVMLQSSPVSGTLHSLLANTLSTSHSCRGHRPPARLALYHQSTWVSLTFSPNRRRGGRRRAAAADGVGGGGARRIRPPVRRRGPAGGRAAAVLPHGRVPRQRGARLGPVLLRICVRQVRGASADRVVLRCGP
jgi:hypothetical protein